MKETIYLIIDANGVQGLRKSAVDVKRGQVIVRLDLEMPTSAFKPPVLQQKVVINDWREGIELDDVKFNNGVITEAEAEMIRNSRIEKVKAMLEERGYVITKEEDRADEF